MSIIFNNQYYNDKNITREFSLKNTHIGYQNLVLNSVVTASSSAAGYETDALKNPFTYDFWRSISLPATVTVDTGSQHTVDYIGLAKHNLAGKILTLAASYDGNNFVDLLQFAPVSNDAIMLIFGAVTARYFRLTTGISSDSTIDADFIAQDFFLDLQDVNTFAQMAVFSVGKSLEMQRMIFGGHAPAGLYHHADVRPVTSEGGAWLGRSIIRKGTPCEYSFSNLTGDWYRSKFDPFAKQTLENPFFISWRPAEYAAECQYAWTDKSIQPQNTGPRDWLSVSFNVIGCD